MDSLETILNYIIESEEQDFLECPSEHHVFYHALVLAYGKAYAENELSEALKNN